jgi:hypothetical protein
MLVEAQTAEIKTRTVYSNSGLAIGRKVLKMITAVTNKGMGHIPRGIYS